MHYSGIVHPGAVMKRRSYSRLVCILSLLLSLGGGCSSEEMPRQAALPAPLVRVMTVTSGDVPVADTFVGETEGSRAVEVRAQVSGILKRRNYEEGSHVEEGQLLFEIEPDSYQAALERARGALGQAQARFTQARQNLNRILPLYARNAVSQQDRDDARSAYSSALADLESARAVVREAEITLGYTRVVSPVSGFAGKEYRTVGNLVAAGGGGESLLTVVNRTDPIYANFSISSPRIMQLRALQAQGRIRSDGITAEIQLADGTVYPRKGKVTFIDRQVDPQTSVVAARAEFENPDLFVMPGQFVRVTVSGMTLVNAMLIPQQAVIQTQEGSMVVVVDKDDRAEMRPVDLGDNYGENFLVNSGLRSGERVVIEGSNKAVPGQPVRVAQEPVAKSVPEALGPAPAASIGEEPGKQPVTTGTPSPAAE